MGKLRVGFIGVGDITDLHYLGYKDNPKAELYAICDVDEERLQKRASEWKVEKTYTDYRELLTDPNIEAVEVITPHHLHAEMGIAALKAGKHVSMQKPMAVNIGECDELIKTAELSKKLFRVFENFRFYPPMVKAKELLDSGAIGEPLSIRIKCVQGTGGDGWENLTAVGHGDSILTKVVVVGSFWIMGTIFFRLLCGIWARWKRFFLGSRIDPFNTDGSSIAQRLLFGNTRTPRNTVPTK